MRPHPIYLISELLSLQLTKVTHAPDSINGDTSPRHAWDSGYLQALQDMTALLEKPEQA